MAKSEDFYFSEVSAKTGEGIQELFGYIVNKVYPNQEYVVNNVI